jgi:RNA polymerase sigma-70 factor (ECF subfamily)
VKYPFFQSLFGQPSDEQAMWRVHLQDDPAAFALLVKRWQLPVQRLCERMLADEHRAEDLSQEAFARVFAVRKNYQPASKFSTFLWRITLNLCYDELRHRRRLREIPLEPADSEEAPLLAVLPAREFSPDEQALRNEQAALVRRALLQLADPYRAVVVLRHYEDLKFREIAEVLEIPEGTVKSRMAEAMTQLHQLLKRFTIKENFTKSSKERLLV